MAYKRIEEEGWQQPSVRQNLVEVTSVPGHGDGGGSLQMTGQLTGRNRERDTGACGKASAPWEHVVPGGAGAPCSKHRNRMVNALMQASIVLTQLLSCDLSCSFDSL